MASSYKTCARNGCRTKLSRYNQLNTCWAHTTGGNPIALSRRACLDCGEPHRAESAYCRPCQKKRTEAPVPHRRELTPDPRVTRQVLNVRQANRRLGLCASCSRLFKEGEQVCFLHEYSGNEWLSTRTLHADCIAE